MVNFRVIINKIELILILLNIVINNFCIIIRGEFLGNRENGYKERIIDIL